MSTVRCIYRLFVQRQPQFFLQHSVVELNRNMVDIVCLLCHLLVGYRFQKYLWQPNNVGEQVYLRYLAFIMCFSFIA